MEQKREISVVQNGSLGLAYPFVADGELCTPYRVRSTECRYSTQIFAIKGMSGESKSSRIESPWCLQQERLIGAEKGPGHTSSLGAAGRYKDHPLYGRVFHGPRAPSNDTLAE